MFQIIQAIENDDKDVTGLSLLAYHNKQSEVIFDDDLLQSELNGRIKYFPFVKEPEPDWLFGDGDLTEKALRDFMPPPNLSDSHVMLCGSKDFTTKASDLLAQLEYKASQISRF